MVCFAVLFFNMMFVLYSRPEGVLCYEVRWVTFITGRRKQENTFSKVKGEEATNNINIILLVEWGM